MPVSPETFGRLTDSDEDEKAVDMADYATPATPGFVPLAAPAAQPAPTTAPTPAPVAAPQLAVKPYRDMQRELDASPYPEQIQQGYEGQLEAQKFRAEAIKDTARAESEAIRAANELRAQQAEELQRQQQMQREALMEADQGVKDAHLLAQYPNMSLEEIKSRQQVLADPDAPREAKAAAKSALDRAGEIDPGRLMGSTSNKLIAILASAIGGVGAGLSGGPNYALQSIQNAIQDDINAQRERFASAKEAAASKRTEYNLLRQQGHDDLEATRLMQHTKLQGLLGKIDEVRARGQGAEKSAELDVLGEQLRTEQAKIQQQLVQDRIAQKAALQGRVDQNRAANIKMQATAAPRRIAGNLEFDPNASNADIKEAKAIAAGSASLRKNAARLRDMAKKGFSWSKSERAIAAQRLEMLIPQLSQMSGSGAPQKEEAERMIKALKNPTQFNVADVERTWNTLVSDIESDINAKLEPYGARIPAQLSESEQRSGIKGAQPYRR